MNLFESLSREIVAFCQNNINDTKKCEDFVKYELYLRTVSKNYLLEIGQQIEPPEDEIFIKENERLGK